MRIENVVLNSSCQFLAKAKSRVAAVAGGALIPLQGAISWLADASPFVATVGVLATCAGVAVYETLLFVNAYDGEKGQEVEQTLDPILQSK